MNDNFYFYLEDEALDSQSSWEEQSLLRTALYSVPCNAGVTKVLFFGESNELVISSQDDGYLNIYTLDGLHRVQGFQAHGDIASSLSINPFHSSQILSSGWDGAINCWDLSSSEYKTPILSINNAHYRHINDVSYHPTHQSIFCSAGQDGFVRIWDTRTDADSKTSSDCFNIFNNQQAVACIEWSTAYPDLVYSGTDDGCIHSFDCRVSGRGPLLTPQKMHRGRVRKIRAFQAEKLSAKDRGTIGDILFSASDDTTIAVSSFTHHGESVALIEKDRLGNLSTPLLFLLLLKV